MSNKKINFSIITPAYNESEHIEQCIKSTLKQSWPHFEMFIVDDGSTDGTADKVEKYSAADDRINLIRLPKNVGLTAAKNAALGRLTGDYLFFLDADDWILPDALSDLVQMIDQFGEVDMFRLRGKEVYSRDEEPETNDDFETQLYSPADLVRENKASGYMHNLCVKHSLVKNNNIRFTDGMIMLEDQQFTMKCMVYSKEVLYFTKQNYMYYQHPDSLSKNFKTEQYPDILNCAASVYRKAKLELQENERKVYRDYAFEKASQYLKRVLKDNDVTADELRSEMDSFLDQVEFQWKQLLWLTVNSRAIAAYKKVTVRK